jgi:hypothetical protein
MATNRNCGVGPAVNISSTVACREAASDVNLRAWFSSPHPAGRYKKPNENKYNHTANALAFFASCSAAIDADHG